MARSSGSLCHATASLEPRPRLLGPAKSHPLRRDPSLQATSHLPRRHRRRRRRLSPLALWRLRALSLGRRWLFLQPAIRPCKAAALKGGKIGPLLRRRGAPWGVLAFPEDTAHAPSHSRSAGSTEGRVASLLPVWTVEPQRVLGHSDCLRGKRHLCFDANAEVLPVQTHDLALDLVEGDVQHEWGGEGRGEEERR